MFAFLTYLTVKFADACVDETLGSLARHVGRILFKNRTKDKLDSLTQLTRQLQEERRQLQDPLYEQSRILAMWKAADEDLARTRLRAAYWEAEAKRLGWTDHR